ncbi:HAD hydrolase-like protein [archaeon]|jgi:HAD superfamily hydrolase (TIGR01509 family)|nr:HAD hydrolase-like protein [archaeon]MBT4646776.1 HAD hydrolase-like protein [archaeon]MBT6822069.1 HAD hydrolase-like protein [archaeon]MBT7392932.1 HAD hydrolase-like protein [archaeon]
MIKAVIYDLDLMLHITPMKFSKYFSKEYGVEHDKVLEFFTDEFQDCVKGKADLKVEIQKYFKSWNWTKGVDELLRIWHEYGYLEVELIKIAENLKKQGIKCILSTNNEKYRMEYFNRVHNFDKIFDSILNSWEVGYKKPQKEMFDRILQVSNVDKNEILFCDDKPHFIIEAKKYGFLIHHYSDVESFKEELEKLGISTM